MKIQDVSIAVVTAVLLGGCASTRTPQNAEDYRKGVVEKAYGTVLETFEVKRPYKDVASVIKAKTKECLNAEARHQSCTRTGFNTNCNNYSDTYRPTIVDGAQKTEVHVQHKRAGEGVGAIFLGGSPPADGMYMVVADVTPIENGKAARVDIYGTRVQRTIPRAIRHWANGTNLGCPELKMEVWVPGMGGSDSEAK